MRRATVHFAVSLPGDTGSIVSGFRAGSRIYICINLLRWLREGRPAYRSTNNVVCVYVCVYEDVHSSYFNYVGEKFLNRELHNDSPNQRIIDCVQEDCLGVAGDGLRASASAHESIRITARDEVRWVSRERSQVAETEPPTEPSQEEAEPLALPPGANAVTLKERACLPEVALSSASAEEPEETNGLQDSESAACVAASTMVSLSDTEDESITAMESLIESM